MALNLEYSCKCCYEEFNDSDRKPLKLDCTKKCSSTCSRCYVQYQKNPSCMTTCALCHTEFDISKPVGEMKINWSLIKKSMAMTSQFSVSVKYNNTSLKVERLLMSDTLMKLQKLIESLTNLTINDQNIIFAGNCFYSEDKTKTLGELGIKPDSKLELTSYAEGA